MARLNENREERTPLSQTPKALRLAFGIFMILVYLGIGLLFILSDMFMLFNNKAISCIVGGLLIAYGIFRGYRLYIGSN